MNQTNTNRYNRARDPNLARIHARQAPIINMTPQVPPLPMKAVAKVIAGIIAFVVLLDFGYSFLA